MPLNIHHGIYRISCCGCAARLHMHEFLSVAMEQALVKNWREGRDLRPPRPADTWWCPACQDCPQIDRGADQ